MSKQQPVSEFRKTVRDLVRDEKVADQIIKAAEELLGVMAEALMSQIAETTIDATAATLLAIYESGQIPGPFPSQRMNQLAMILVGQVSDEQSGSAREGSR